MDAFSDGDVEVVVGMLASQTGKTSSLENVLGYHIDQDPAPILGLQPTLEMAETFSKDRLAPMLRDTPVLHGKVGDARSRDGDNTLLHKAFPGGHITLAGANSPASLASRPIRLMLADEVDRYPASAGNEGDPVALARKRTATFWNRKIGLISSPTIKGLSRIERAYEESDKRRFWVPCPACGEMQVLRWARVFWPSGEPEKAVYGCEHCDAPWEDVLRWHAVSKGEWRAEAPFNGIAGFHLSSLYSPWVSLGKLAQAFVAAKPYPERLRVFVNTELAETFEEGVEGVDEHALLARLEPKWEKLPAAVLLLTAGVDVQDDRLEVEVVGWGKDEQSWSVDHLVLNGDPSGPELWRQLDQELLHRYETVDGRHLVINAACVDTGGHYTQMAYQFCRARRRRRIWAIKGHNIAGKPVWPKRATRNNKAKVDLFMVGVDAGKDVVFARLRVPSPGPGYCHFPDDRDETYFRQFAAEQVITRHVKGFPVRQYVRKPGERNEALDLRVYAYAALCSLNVRWVPTKMPKPTSPPEPDAPRPAPVADAAEEQAPSAPPPPPKTPNTVKRLKRRRSISRYV